MKKCIDAAAILALVACAKKEATNAPAATTSSSAEDAYPMTATIVSRDPVKNMLNLDNKEVPGKVMAMHASSASACPPREWRRTTIGISRTISR